MRKIAFLVPHSSSVPVITDVVAPFDQIAVEYCGDYHAVIDFASQLIAEGCEIIIARAGTASRIKRSHLNVTVVELAVTGFDIIRALIAAKEYGSNIAVVAYSSMVQGLDCLAQMTDCSFRQYLTERDDSDIETLVLAAIRDGAEVIVGGGVFCQAAQKHGIPAVYIENGKEAIMQAAAEACRLQTAIEEEKHKRSLYAAVIDHVTDGIITVDCQQLITSINLRAQQVFAISSAQAIGQHIGKVWPGISLVGVLRTGEQELNKITQVKGLKVVVSKIPIVVNGKPTGALLVFQEIIKIQQTEAQIRKEIYNKGHVAKKNFADVGGKSTAITQSIDLAKEFATTSSNVLIVGETGTGKEVFAQSIHNYSSRHAGPFVAVNCAALPAQILESELFGYVSGAFTGANKEGKPGLFELAHGGTIFLDEIAEMDYTNQSRLLRVLQERSVMRLGSDRVIAIDTRVIAATNKDLKELVLTRKFREDLFFRLNVLKLQLPPLRERRQDIRMLAELFLCKYALPPKNVALSAAAAAALEAHNWPGNVRELQNTMERLVAFCRTDTVQASDVDAVVEKWDLSPAPAKPSFHDEEIQEILAALAQARGVQTVAAKLLGIDRTTLWRKMRRLGIEK